MNMFARFDENPAILRKQNVTDGRTHTQTHARMDNVKTVYPPQTKFAGGIKFFFFDMLSLENIISDIVPNVSNKQ